MPNQKNLVRSPVDAPKTFATEPISIARRGPGRPKNLPANPPLPTFQLLDGEKELYDFFIQAIEEDYPGLKPSDRLLLPLAAASYILWLRTVQHELVANEVITMSRQHPATFFSRLMSQILGTTRSQRVKQGDDKDDGSEFERLYA